MFAQKIATRRAQLLTTVVSLAARPALNEYAISNTSDPVGLGINRAQSVCHGRSGFVARHPQLRFIGRIDQPTCDETNMTTLKPLGRNAVFASDDPWEAETRAYSAQARLSLRAIGGPLHGDIFGTSGDQVSFGRWPGCAIRMNASECSRVHARIQYRSGRFWLEDLNTLNGTKLNGRLIEQPTALNEGDRIAIGEQEFEVSLTAIHGRRMVIDSLDREPARAPAVRRVAEAPRLPPPGRRPRRSSWRIPGAVGAALLSATLVVYAARRVAPLGPEWMPPATAPASAAHASPPSLPRRLHPREATFELIRPVSMRATSSGMLTYRLPQGSVVEVGDSVATYRESTVEARNQLERLNARLEDAPDDRALSARAEAAALKVFAPQSLSLRSPLRGVVVSAPALRNGRVSAGQELARLSARVQLRVSAEAVEGDGSHCSVSFLDQDNHPSVDAEQLPGSNDSGRAFQLPRIPPGLSTSVAGRVQVRCRR